MITFYTVGLYLDLASVEINSKSIGSLSSFCRLHVSLAIGALSQRTMSVSS
jgi:hypothetical protein